MTPSASADLIVIGAGAAGLATAIFAARTAPALRVLCLDGARRLGAKILVSGGSRCNVTNREVTEHDFWGGSPRVVRGVLRAFPAARAIAFFEELGVALHEEEDGKLFPDSHTSRTVLAALLREAEHCGVELRTGARVSDLRREEGTLVMTLDDGRLLRAPMAVLCTGGRSLPKTGSDGFGYELARRLGHGCVETVPALAPLIFDGWQTLSGVSHHAALTLHAAGRPVVTLEGSLLWTHFGASGPAALNLSRHWHRAVIADPGCTVTLNVCPGETFETLDAWLRVQAQTRARALVATVLAARMPAALARHVAREADLSSEATMAHMSRPDRHALVRAATATTLPVRGSRGFAYAEVTAGGIPLEEIDPATMQSRVCPGLFFAGEIADVDGRLGGFNFQWAWSSAWVAAHAIARQRLR